MDFEINWARELLGLFIWCLIIGFIIGISYLFWAYRNGARRGNLTNDLFDYKRLPDFVPKDAILMDTHAHTLYSDGKMTTEQTVLWHIANGFKVMVLSDHNTTKGNPELKELQKKYPEILLIPGIEWTNQSTSFHVHRKNTLQNAPIVTLMMQSKTAHQYGLLQLPILLDTVANLTCTESSSFKRRAYWSRSWWFRDSQRDEMDWPTIGALC